MSKRFGGIRKAIGLIHLRFPTEEVADELLGTKHRLSHPLVVLCVHQKWKCAYCGCQLTSINASIDHVIPKSRGGLHRALDNMVAACKPCNGAKGAKLLSEWRKEA